MCKVHVTFVDVIESSRTFQNVLLFKQLLNLLLLFLSRRNVQALGIARPFPPVFTDLGVTPTGRTLPERRGRDRISGKFGRWNFGAIPRQSALVWLEDMEQHAENETEADAARENAAAESLEHPWNTLATVTTFHQGGSDMKPTFCLNDIKEDQKIGEITPKIRKSREPQITQASILIESLVQQLCNILEGDKVHRKKLYNAICKKLDELQIINGTWNTMELDRLKQKYQRAFYQMFLVARSEHYPKSNNVLDIPRYISIPKMRYFEEFIEISFIAHGGFGTVYKAQHRLDGIEYAIKKIFMPANRIEMIQKQLNEVRALAKLNHTNIVSYNAAWIETYNSTVPCIEHKSNGSHTSNHHRKASKSHKSKSLQDELENLFSNKKGLNLNNTKVYHTEQSVLLNTKASFTTDMYTDIRKKKRHNVYGNGGNNGINNRNGISKRFEELDLSIIVTEEKITKKSNKEESTEESSSDVVFFQDSKSNENLDHTVTDIDTSNSDSDDESSSLEISSYIDKNRPYVILYIQMALCEQTLEQWLHGKISVTPEPMYRAIFQQILCGVDYMHSQNIVHHDIKPSNIFISTSGQLQIQLGDFGLACPQIGNQKEIGNHSVVGTHIYAAPEQLKGECDPKSDIYSIGVVLVELLILIKTQMELSNVVGCLKNGKIPAVLKQHKWAQIVQQLVQEDPAKRPSSSQLLQDFNYDNDMIISEMKNTIENLEHANRIKAKTIQELQEEVALLKEELQKLKNS